MLVKKLSGTIVITMLLFAAVLFVNMQAVFADDIDDVLTVGKLQYTLNNDGTATVCKFTGDTGQVIIPGTVSDGVVNYAVTGIESRAFYHTDLSSVTIPASMKSIGNEAFRDCTSLQTVDFAGASQLQTIGTNAFYNCYNLQTVDFGSMSQLQTIEYSAFGFCRSVQTVDLSGAPQLQTIKSYAFAYCRDLQSVDLSGAPQLQTIGNHAFSECAHLQTAVLPVGLTSIGEGAFSPCVQLSRITIPATVTEIGDFAFAGAGSNDEVNSFTLTIASDSNLSIGDSVLVNTGEISGLTIPPSVTQIGLNDGDVNWADGAVVHYIGTRGLWRSMDWTWEDWAGTQKTKPEIHFIESEQIYQEPIVQATPDRYGKIMYKCDACSSWSRRDIIHKPAEVQLSETSYVYDGSAKTPDVTVTDDAGQVIDGSNYEVACSNNTSAGTATATVTFTGDHFAGTLSRDFTITPLSIKTATISGVKAKTYNGKAQTQTPVVKVGDTTLASGMDYKLSYKSNTNAGTASMTITGTGSCTGKKTASFTIRKAANPMTVKAKTATVKYKNLKKKNLTVATKNAYTVKKARGTVTYTKYKGHKKITVAKSGKITVKKKLKKGTYNVKVKVKAAGNSNYKAATKTVNVRIKVR